MSDSQHFNHDALEEAIRAFQEMRVCERPSDAEVLARFDVSQGDLSQPFCMPIPSRRKHLMHLVGSATAAAVLLFGARALFLWNSSPPESPQVAATSPDRPGDVAVQPLPRSAKSERLSVPSLQETVAESQVIVVATGLDSAPAPLEVPGDLPEIVIRWQVKRVLKGELARMEISTRTSVAAAEFLGKDWIIFLSPDYMAGKLQLAACTHIECERTVNQVIAAEKK